MAVCTSCSDDEPKDGESTPSTEAVAENAGDGEANSNESDGLTPNRYPMVCQLWLHENGINILDFRYDLHETVIQLVKRGSKEYYFYDTSWGTCYLFDDREGYYDISFEGCCSNFLWKVKSVTADKLVLQGMYDDFEDVYYLASSDILPDPCQHLFSSTFGEVYSYPYAEWIVGGKI